MLPSNLHATARVHAEPCTPPPAVIQPRAANPAASAHRHNGASPNTLPETSCPVLSCPVGATEAPCQQPPPHREQRPAGRQRAAVSHLSCKGLAVVAGGVNFMQRKGVRDRLLGGGHLQRSACAAQRDIPGRLHPHGAGMLSKSLALSAGANGGAFWRLATRMPPGCAAESVVPPHDVPCLLGTHTAVGEPRLCTATCMPAPAGSTHPCDCAPAGRAAAASTDCPAPPS